MLRRCFSAILILAMVVALVPWTSVVPVQAAQQASPAESLLDMSQQLTEASKQETAEGEDPGGYALLDLRVSNKVATVTYSAREDATIIVAVYSEDGKQLKSSASAPASADQSSVEITLETVPSYFQAAAYLVRTGDLAPLCQAYKTSRYTEDIQKLIKSTVSTYGEKRVINLDEDESTNFMVLQKGVVQIFSTETANRFTAVDQENHRYVIEAADKTAKNMKVGDIFACKLPDALITAKITEIAVDGSTVTIGGTDAQAKEIFSHVKIEAEGTADQVRVNESTLGEGVTFLGLVPGQEDNQQTGRQINQQLNAGSSLSPDNFFENEEGEKINFLAFKVKPDKNDMDLGGDTSLETEFEFTVEVGLKLSHDVYVANDMSVTDVRIDSGIRSKTELEASYKGKAVELGEWTWSPIFGVDIGFEPYIGIELSGSVEAEFEAVYSTAIYYDTEAGTFNHSAPAPKIETEMDLKGELFVGLDFNPTVEVLEGLLLDADVKAMLGLFFTGKLKGTGHGDVAQPPEDGTKPMPKELHSCISCIDGDITAGVKLGLELTIGGLALVKEAEMEYIRAYHLSDFYYCLLGPIKIPPYGLGKCPDRKFLVTVEVLDERGDCVADSAVTAVNYTNPLETTRMGTTNRNGVVKNYISTGWYFFKLDDQSKWDIPVCITGAGKVRLDGDRLFYTSLEPGHDLMPMLDKILKAGEVAGQGTSENGNVQWSITSGGFLKLTGTGPITEKPWTKVTGTVKVVTIGEGITGIGDDIFNQAGTIWVELPTTLKTIGKRAFYYTRLETASLENITDIGEEAFSGCNKLQSVVFSETINSIGKSAFKDCSALDNVILPTNLTRIEEGVFEDCENLASVSVSNQLTHIGSRAFYGCEKLSYLRITDKLCYIGQYGLCGCSLTEVKLNNDNAQLGYGAFSGCKELRTVRLPANMTTIPGNLFSGCASLESISIPQNVTEIEGGAFSGCETLVSVTVPDKVTAIGSKAFSGCTGLEAVYVPDGLESIGEEAYYNCKALRTTRIPDSVTQVGEGVFKCCESLPGIGLPSGMTEIPEYMFYGCKSLQEVRWSPNLTSIKDWAFYDSGLVELVLPQSVTNLGLMYVFASCKNLQRVVIPEATPTQPGITSLPLHCFSGCSALVSVTLPTQLKSISTECFKSCTALETITLPDGVTTISGWAFDGCTSLRTVKLPPKLTAIYESAFQNCSSLTDINLGNALETIGEYAFYGSGLVNITIPESVRSVGESCFSRNARLQTVQFPTGLSHFGDSMFMYSPALIWVKLPQNMKTLPYRTFYGCTSLKTVDMPDGLEHIGSNCFEGCSSLESVELPDSLKDIEYNAFIGCGSLGSIEFPYGMTTIGGYAFNGCEALTTVTFPATLTGMGMYAFSGCDKLTTAYFEGDAPAGKGWFVGNTMVIYYPAGNETWTDSVRESADLIGLDRQIWIPYQPPVRQASETAAAVASQAQPASVEIEPLRPTAQPLGQSTIPSGELTQQTVSGKVVRTITYQDLVPGQSYLLLAVSNVAVETLLSNENVLYVAQVTADEEGNLSHSYIQRTETTLSFVLLCGATVKSVADATVTFAPMWADGSEQAVDAIVTYDGRRLQEGRDYLLEGDVTYTQPGTYTCTVRGIGVYSGTIQCTYTVADYLPGDVDCDKTVTTDDAVYLLLHVMFGEEDYPVPDGMELNFDGSGEVTTDDAVYLLLYAMFGAEDYPLSV